MDEKSEKKIVRYRIRIKFDCGRIMVDNQINKLDMDEIFKRIDRARERLEESARRNSNIIKLGKIVAINILVKGG